MKVTNVRVVCLCTKYTVCMFFTWCEAGQTWEMLVLHIYVYLVDGIVEPDNGPGSFC